MAQSSIGPFDLRIERSGDRYRARVVKSPFGEASGGEFRWPFTDTEIDSVLQLASGVHRNLVPSEADARLTHPAGTVKEFGTRLFKAVFDGEVLRVLERSIDRANEREAHLPIRLRLNDVPELARVPWEYLYWEDRGRFLALSRHTPIVRYIELDEPADPLPVELPLRILVMVSKPQDTQPLNTDREWSGLVTALDDLIGRDMVRIERLERATWGTLVRRLHGGHHVFHFMGHGSFDSQRPVLWFEDEQGNSKAVDAEHLAHVLSEQRSLRLAVLNACEGARAPVNDLFGGVAQRLIQGRLPAALAMQYPITDPSAIAFARHFYTALASDPSIDAALATARLVMFGESENAEWGTPVLYLRSPDGRLFDVASKPAEAQCAALLRHAREARDRGEWVVAEKRLQALLELDSNHDQAKDLLKDVLREVQAGQHIATLYVAGREHFDAGQWPEALAALRDVKRLGGNYKDVIRLIKTAESALGGRLDAVAPAPVSRDPLEQHYATVIRAMRDGRVVPFLGPGFSMCGRPADSTWQRGTYLPNASELAEYLVDHFGYPGGEPDLLHVSQYVALTPGTGRLYEELRKLYAADYSPNAFHKFLASFPAKLRRKGYPVAYQLIVTTHYDDVLERSFRNVGEPFDLLSYIAEGEHRGKFWHYPPEARPCLVEKPNEYDRVSTEQRTVIVKMHGAIDRETAERDSYVITEDHYIDYLVRADVNLLVPVHLAAKLRTSHFLFLGYTPRDWNLRGLLLRIWGGQKLTYQSWAVHDEPKVFDEQYWRKRDVELLPVRLDEYVAGLSQRLEDLPPER